MNFWMKPFLIVLVTMALFMEFVGVASRVIMAPMVVHVWLEWSCPSQLLRSCVLVGSSLRLNTKVRSPPAVSVICQTMLPERVLMSFVLTVTSLVTPSVTVQKTLNAASIRRMVIMPLIVACPGGIALPWLTLTFMPLLCHILRILLLMCLLPVLPPPPPLQSSLSPSPSS